MTPSSGFAACRLRNGEESAGAPNSPAVGRFFACIALGLLLGSGLARFRVASATTNLLQTGRNGDDLIIVQCDEDNGDHSFIAGFDKNNGNERWRTARQVEVSWTTPVVARLPNRVELVSSGSQYIASYDPKRLYCIVGRSANQSRSNRFGLTFGHCRAEPAGRERTAG
jgi:hypothetical protein